jgi:hypothetical protein
MSFAQDADGVVPDRSPSFRHDEGVGASVIPTLERPSVDSVSELDPEDDHGHFQVPAPELDPEVDYGHFPVPAPRPCSELDQAVHLMVARADNDDPSNNNDLSEVEVAQEKPGLFCLFAPFFKKFKNNPLSCPTKILFILMNTNN